eukprot:gb/GEZN01008950.1/.p1 GENE.gb/GEZN01008950.1/~~gb/GEZN01008950.1/.p1  ORF type:complete len:164 (+),score=19.44 gb/GEZN01008950.1/:798-1289(+)
MRRRRIQSQRNKAENSQPPLHQWIDKQIQMEQTGRHQRKGIMVGTHLCGELGPSFVEAYLKSERVVGMLLVPCCMASRRQDLMAEADVLQVDWFTHWCQYLLKLIPPELGPVRLFQDPAMASVKNTFIVAWKQPPAVGCHLQASATDYAPSICSVAAMSAGSL